MPATGVRPIGQKLPWDVLFIVVQYADRGTLAALGAVATELLRVTAPLLYETVEIKTIKQLELLFRPRMIITSPARVSSHVSFAHTRRLVLRFDSTVPNTPTRPRLSRARIANPLRLETLVVSVEFKKRALVSHLHMLLFPYLDPLRVEYGFRLRPPNAWSLDLDARPFPSEWTRLQSVDYKGGVIINQVKVSERLNEIRVHCATFFDRGNVLRQFEVWYSSRSHESRAAVIFVVQTEGEKAAMKAIVDGTIFTPSKKVFKVQTEKELN